MTKLYIRNMVCSRCTMAVRSVLERLGIEPLAIELGEVDIAVPLDTKQRQQLVQMLLPLGFELIDDRKSRLISGIKTSIIELVHYAAEPLRVNLSDYLHEKLGHDYSYMSNLFSETEGITIEKFFIAQKIEKVKELLMYDELTLSEIAHRLNYSSVAYLSSQFKKVTGLTPSFFKALGSHKRAGIDSL